MARSVPKNFEKIRNAGISDEALEWNYTHGVSDPTRVSPDNWVLQRALVNRPGNKEIMLDLLYDYRTNPGRYPAVAGILPQAPAANADRLGQERRHRQIGPSSFPLGGGV